MTLKSSRKKEKPINLVFSLSSMKKIYFKVDGFEKNKFTLRIQALNERKGKVRVQLVSLLRKQDEAFGKVMSVPFQKLREKIQKEMGLLKID